MNFRFQDIKWVKQYKKIMQDMALTLVAAGAPIMVLQLVILPLLATRMNEDDYGLVLTIVSVVTVIAGSLGSSLHNFRLVKQNAYAENGEQGDFSVILIGEMLICSMVVGIALRQYKLEALDCLWIILMAILWLAREYFIVAFRIRLDFVGVVLNNIVLVVGYIIGFLLFLIWDYWELIYITGMLLSLFYVAGKTEIMREKLSVTSLMKTTIKDLSFLTIAAIANSLLWYADRLIIYPIVGGAAVSVYYVSTLLGKMVSMVVQPFDTVFLSYLSKKSSVKKSMWGQTVLISVLLACVGYVISLLLAYPMLRLIYPQWAEEAIELMPITTATAMVSMMVSVLYAFILKMCAMKWQLIINISALSAYLFLAVPMYRLYGMPGFCAGVLLSNVMKLVIMLVLGFRATKKA